MPSACVCAQRKRAGVSSIWRSSTLRIFARFASRLDKPEGLSNSERDVVVGDTLIADILRGLRPLRTPRHRHWLSAAHVTAIAAASS